MNLFEPLEAIPTTIIGRKIRLDPLSLDHLEPLCEVGLLPEIWRWYPKPIRTSLDMRRFIENALLWQKEGSALPFVITDLQSGTVIGSTRFGNVDKTNKRVEIGWTWLTPQWQRTYANTEAKYLLLKHAFDELGCIRVEFKTDSLNEKSRKALLRIGAKEEGVLREHIIVWDGRLRHSVVYSILRSEWPSVKRRLEEIVFLNYDRPAENRAGGPGL